MLTMSWGRRASQMRYKTCEGKEQMGVCGNMALGLDPGGTKMFCRMVYKMVSFVQRQTKN